MVDDGWRVAGSGSKGRKVGRLKSIQSHAVAHVGVLDHLFEFVEADLAVAVKVSFHDGLVDNLLKLLVLEVAANHHLEDDEELAVADVTVTVNVVDLEGETQLFLLVSF